MDFNELDKDELVALITAYDCYIQQANDDNRYFDGWRPVCISEFYDNEFQLMSDNDGWEDEI